MWLAQEWQLPQCPKVGRSVTKPLLGHIEAHGISYDWLLLGDLLGLQRMMLKRRMRITAATPESLRDKLARLSESEREIISKMVDQLGATS